MTPVKRSVCASRRIFRKFCQKFSGFWRFYFANFLFIWETSLIAQGPQGVPPPPANFFSNLTREFQAVNSLVFISPFLTRRAMFGSHFAIKKLSWSRARHLPSRENCLKSNFALQYAPCLTHRLAATGDFSRFSPFFHPRRPTLAHFLQ